MNRPRELLARAGLVLVAVLAAFLLTRQQTDLRSNRHQLNDQGAQLQDAQHQADDLAAQLDSVTTDLETARAQLGDQLDGVTRGVDQLPSRLPRPVVVDPSPDHGGSPGPAGPPGPPGPTGPVASPDRPAPPAPCPFPTALAGVLCP